MNPMMGGIGSTLFMMTQMTQMMQMMQMMQGSMGGQPNGMDPYGGRGCSVGMGPMFGLQGYPSMPSMLPLPMPMPMPQSGGGYGPNGYGGQNSWPLSSGPLSDVGAFANTGPTGQSLLQSMRNRPIPPGCSPGYCYRGVKAHLRTIGVNLQGNSAFQAADQLAQNPKFAEVRVSRDQLRSLPAGAVVVWDRDPSNRSSGGGKRHGHISISDGRGHEYSDKPRNQMTNYGPRFRVFVPRDAQR